MQNLINTLRDCWSYGQQHRSGIPQNIYPEDVMQQLVALKWIILQDDRYCVTQSGLDFLASLEETEVIWPEQAAAEHAAHRPLVAALEAVTKALADSIDSICQHYATAACNSSAMYTLAIRRVALVHAARTILNARK